MTHAALDQLDRQDLLDFLNSLILFPTGPHGVESEFRLPERGHSSIFLTVLFNNPKNPQ